MKTVNKPAKKPALAKLGAAKKNVATSKVSKRLTKAKKNKAKNGAPTIKTDLQIQKEVLAELSRESSIGSLIGVAVKNGVVTLTGILDSFHKKSVAEKAALRVKGVLAISEEIKIKSGHGYLKNDSELAADILRSLRIKSDIDPSGILIKVEDAIVTLSGRVKWPYQKKDLEKIAGEQIGVRAIVNEIRT